MWKEYFQFDAYAKGQGSTFASIVDGTLEHYQMTGIAGVTDIGDDRNWCRHFSRRPTGLLSGDLHGIIRCLQKKLPMNGLRCQLAEIRLLYARSIDDDAA